MVLHLRLFSSKAGQARDYTLTHTRDGWTFNSLHGHPETVRPDGEALRQRRLIHLLDNEGIRPPARLARGMNSLWHAINEGIVNEEDAHKAAAEFVLWLNDGTPPESNWFSDYPD